MSVKCKDIIAAMERLAPPYLAEKWDNVGLMVGSGEKNADRILFALDCRDEVIDEAIKIKADMIITHHPLIFSGIKSIDFSTPIGGRLERLIKNDIAVYSAHTNLDIADGGTNYTLAGLLDLENIEGLVQTENPGFYMGRTGELKEEMPLDAFVKMVKERLGAEKIAVCGKTEGVIKKVGICTGAGSCFMAEAAAKGCDAYITGDMKYHDGQQAQELGLCVIDGTHYLTEVIVVPVLRDFIKKNFETVDCVASSVNTQTIHII